MRSRYLLLALLVGLGLALLVSLPSPAGESADKEKIDKLIDQLGSDTFAQRKKAVKELAAVGAPALEALRKAAKSEDAEVRKHAEELVKKIEKEVASAQILGPKRLHLVYKDTPVPEAVADFQKKSGYKIHLHDPEGKLKERKITLDTGETTFWHAYGLFCEKAGLAEATMQDVMQGPGGPPGGGPVPLPGVKPLPPQRLKPAQDAPPPPPPGTPAPPAAPPAPPAPAGFALTLQVADTPAPQPAVKPLLPAAPPVAPPGKPVGGPGRVVGPMMPFMPGMPGQLLLKDGKAKKMPTDDRGAVRVRALPKADMFGGAPEGELILALEATPEPKLQWQQFQSIRIDKALDDQDQNLTQVMPQVPGAPPGAGIGIPGAPPGVVRPAIMMPVGPWGGMNQPIAVQLKKGEKAAKSLKELKGAITAQVLSEAKPMITAKLEKKVYKGDEGGSIKITEVKTEGKKTTIRFEFEQPPDTIAAAPQMPGMPGMGMGVAVPAFRILPAAPAVPPPAVPPPAPPGAKAPAPAPRDEAAKDEAARAKAAEEEAAARAKRDAKIKEEAVRRQQAQQRAQERAAQVQVQVQVQGGQGGVAIRGGGAPAFVGPMNGLSVQDDKGNALPMQMAPQQVRVIQGGGGANAFIITYTFICEPGKDQGDPAKVVYLGRKRVTVDVPFVLKDVPLP
jgi:hypothetical protein